MRQLYVRGPHEIMIFDTVACSICNTSVPLKKPNPRMKNRTVQFSGRIGRFPPILVYRAGSVASPPVLLAISVEQHMLSTSKSVETRRKITTPFPMRQFCAGMSDCSRIVVILPNRWNPICEAGNTATGSLASTTSRYTDEVLIRKL